jgi:hypothetical protein
MSKKKTKYTTIQVRRDINELIRELCKQNGWVASTITEKHWIGLISASMSGSLSFREV